LNTLVEFKYLLQNAKHYQHDNDQGREQQATDKTKLRRLKKLNYVN